jgi:N-ethylmaleimide reductase
MSSSNAEVSDLFVPFQFGPYKLSNRIVMAPLTRSRAQAGDLPSLLAAQYYRQRSTAGLIITEATQISAQGKGYAFTPGIYNNAQVEGWKSVTAAVHQDGGRIFLQLWHVGRISHPSLQPSHALPVAPSAIKPEGKAFTEGGFLPFVTPRALETSEIAGIVEQYHAASQYALDAGFDGVEIHAANGYLIDQFLRDSTNHRTDIYGGSLENRTRLLMEVTAAVVSVWPADRVGVRLSPISPANDISDSDPATLFSYVVEQLSKFNLLYLHVIEGATGGPRSVEDGFDLQLLRKLFNGVYIGNNGYDREMAIAAREHNLVDMVAFGRPFISNPDLVARLKLNATLNKLDVDTLYGGGAKGYIDYPFLNN